MPDFRRSSDILDLASLNEATDDGARSVRLQAQGILKAASLDGASPLGYDAAQVAGYAATRLPATYAVLLKVRRL